MGLAMYTGPAEELPSAETCRRGGPGPADTARPGQAAGQAPAASFPSSRGPCPLTVSPRSHAARRGPQPQRAEPAVDTRPRTRLTPRIHGRPSSASPRSVRGGPPVSGAPAAPGAPARRGRRGAAGVLQAPSRAPGPEPHRRPGRVASGLPRPPARGPVGLSVAPTPAALTSVPDSALWRSLHIVPNAPRTRYSTFPPPAALTTGGDVPASQGRPSASQRRSAAASEARMRAAPAFGPRRRCRACAVGRGPPPLR